MSVLLNKITFVVGDTEKAIDIRIKNHYILKKSRTICINTPFIIKKILILQSVILIFPSVKNGKSASVIYANKFF